jgi:hypothetical protein
MAKVSLHCGILMVLWLRATGAGSVSGTGQNTDRELADTRLT